MRAVEKRLNIDALRDALKNKGLNAATVAQKLDVSREAVSKWLNGESIPKPDKLLRLGSLLSMGFGDLMMARDEPDAPVVAFRKMKGTKTKDDHYEHAKEMGRHLEQLVSLLPFDTLKAPPTFKNPSCDYGYVRRATAAVRADMHVSLEEPVDFTHLIKRFADLQTVLIPVLWGAKKNHANAVHIYLPKSGTTWVYLNLDVNVHDFKFWMAHELGHTLTPDLHGDAGEDFADAFAAALLFPHELAEKAYREVLGERQSTQLQTIQWWAKKLLISPFTVYCQLNQYARYKEIQELQLDKVIHPVTTRFNGAYPNLSETLFGSTQPEPTDYIKTAQENFETPFFDVLGQYLRKSDRGPGFVQTVLDTALLDAKAIHAELK
jgi:transcriptional regulator with XRE-family HTH domain